MSGRIWRDVPAERRRQRARDRAATGAQYIEDAFADRDRTALVDATREAPARVVAIEAGERR